MTKSQKKIKEFKSANWRIVIPNLEEYKNSSPHQLHQLKCLILQRLNHRPQDKRSHIKSQFDRGLRYYHIAVERHANNVPHLDILLIYDKSIQRQVVDFDFLLKHGNITTYRKLNAAILDYGKKQDKDALSNLPQDKLLPSGQTTNQLITVQQLKKDPYRYLELQMLKDPLHFNLQQYCRQHDLYKHISSWSSIKSKLKDSQVAAANLTLKNKPGFKFIDRALIQSKLSPSELKIFDSWVGYQKIVNKLNQIVLYGSHRPFRTTNLYISGSTLIGKSMLAQKLKQFIPVYSFGTSKWFPAYKEGVYRLMNWQQFNLTTFPYTDLLQHLDGSNIQLQWKGGSLVKYDNPLVYMTSNLTLDQHIVHRFQSKPLFLQKARQNLPSRVQQLRVPLGYDLFLLHKLLISDD